MANRIISAKEITVLDSNAKSKFSYALSAGGEERGWNNRSTASSLPKKKVGEVITFDDFNIRHKHDPIVFMSTNVIKHSINKKQEIATLNDGANFFNETINGLMSYGPYQFSKNLRNSFTSEGLIDNQSRFINVNSIIKDELFEHIQKPPEEEELDTKYGKWTEFNESSIFLKVAEIIEPACLLTSYIAGNRLFDKYKKEELRNLWFIEDVLLDISSGNSNNFYTSW